MDPSTHNLQISTKKERNFPVLELTPDPGMLTTDTQPVLVIQSPKTPTLSRKLKAVSLDSDQSQKNSLEVSRDVFSMPNTPKKQLKLREFEERESKLSNLKRFASNTSISGSQTLKTLPEIMTLQDFSDSRPEPIRIKAKGLLERRGSNASLTIDLGNSEPKTLRLNTAKSVSNLNLTTFGSEKCPCAIRCDKLHLEACGGCTIYETLPNKSKCRTFHKRCSCLCNVKCRRKSLSNENLYVPPCSCHNFKRDCASNIKHCKGARRAVYPRQADLDPSQLLSEDFKLHLQNVQYLQTAGSVLSIADLKSACEAHRVPKLHQEFWEVPLNLQEKCLVSGSQAMNRYKGVLPNEHSRVHLPEPQNYIHANYIKGPDYTETAYIATQGPMAHTCEDFWDMVWINKSNCIVMLTGLVEKGKSKCELYFPLGKSCDQAERSFLFVKTTKLQDRFTFDRSSSRYEEEIVQFEELNELTCGHYNVRYLSQKTVGECTIRELELARSDEKRAIRHFWYPNWQDHKMASPKHVLQLALNVLKARTTTDNNNFNGHGDRHAKKRVSRAKRPSLNSQDIFDNQNKEGPVVVHCSAGIGRTGCFLAVLNGIRQLRGNFNVDVLAILCSLRLNRGGMVQTAEQYELIHKVLGLYAAELM